MKLLKNRKVLAFLLVLAICASAVLGFLWNRETRDHSDLEQLCAYSALNAWERFQDHREQGSVYSYHYGVAELVSFYNSYSILITESTGSSDTNRLYMNQLIGDLMSYPALTSEQIDELVSITAMLADDIYDNNAYLRAFLLHHALTVV